ncbi:MAG TPA: hypothetical protein VN213_10130 [Solirubrobacteraceae bacterium]|nr:hypothetical protein [Solirubrobacteraceae bacterium]
MDVVHPTAEDLAASQAARERELDDRVELQVDRVRAHARVG